MRPSELFKRETLGDIFAHTVRYPRCGLKLGDVVTCSRSKTPSSGNLVVLVNDTCSPWVMQFEDAGPEIVAGASVVGVALVMSRDLIEGDTDD